MVECRKSWWMVRSGMLVDYWRSQGCLFAQLIGMSLSEWGGQSKTSFILEITVHGKEIRTAYWQSRGHSAGDLCDTYGVLASTCCT